MSAESIASDAKKKNSSHHTLHEKTEAVANAAAEKTHDGIQKIGETIEHLAANAETYNKEIATYVEKNPVKSLLIAGLSGMLLGMLIKK